MPGRFRARISYANVTSTLALFIALGGVGAYAADTIGSSDVIDESLLTQDIKNGEVQNADLGAAAVTFDKLGAGSVRGTTLNGDAVTTTKIQAGAVQTADIQDGSVTSAKVLDDVNAGGGLGQADLATSSVNSAEIATDAVAALEIQNDSIDAGEIVDFGLTNQDVGVLFAEVSSAGALNNSSGGGVTVTRVGAVGGGTYEVDFARTITTCTAVATLGGATTSTFLGEVNVADRAGNSEAVFVDTNNSDGTAADKAFRLVVVC